MGFDFKKFGEGLQGVGIAMGGDDAALMAFNEMQKQKQKEAALSKIMQGFKPTPMQDGMVGTPTPPKYSSFTDAIPDIGEYFPEMALKFYADQGKKGLDTGAAYKRYVAARVMGQEPDPQDVILGRVHELTTPEIGGRMFNPNTGAETTKMPSAYGGALSQMSSNQQPTEQPYAMRDFYQYTNDAPPPIPQQPSALPQLAANTAPRPQQSNELRVSDYYPSDYNSMTPIDKKNARAEAQKRYTEDVKSLRDSNIQGLKRIEGDYVPNAEDIKNAKRLKEGRKGLQESIAYYEGLVKKYGFEVEGSPEARKLNNAKKQIVLKLKDLEELGALQEADMKIVEDMIGTSVYPQTHAFGFVPLPDTLMNIHRKTGLPFGITENAKDTALFQLEGFKKYIDRKYVDGLSAAGFYDPESINDSSDPLGLK